MNRTFIGLPEPQPDPYIGGQMNVYKDHIMKLEDRLYETEQNLHNFQNIKKLFSQLADSIYYVPNLKHDQSACEDENLCLELDFDDFIHEKLAEGMNDKGTLKKKGVFIRNKDLKRRLWIENIARSLKDHDFLFVLRKIQKFEKFFPQFSNLKKQEDINWRGRPLQYEGEMKGSKVTDVHETIKAVLLKFFATRQKFCSGNHFY